MPYGKSAIFDSAKLVSLKTGDAILLLGVFIEGNWITWKSPTLDPKDREQYGDENHLIINWKFAGKWYTMEYECVIVEDSTAARANLPPGRICPFTLTVTPLESA